MLRIVSIIIFLFLLSSCRLFNMTNNPADDRYARCIEIKRQIMFLNATNDERIAQQRAAELDSLYRAYRENGCC